MYKYLQQEFNEGWISLKLSTKWSKVSIIGHHLYSDAIALSLPMQLELLSILSYYGVVIEVAVVERAVIAPEYGWCRTLYSNIIILKFEI